LDPNVCGAIELITTGSSVVYNGHYLTPMHDYNGPNQRTMPLDLNRNYYFLFWAKKISAK
jgi:hypothetical protein